MGLECVDLACVDGECVDTAWMYVRLYIQMLYYRGDNNY